MSTLVEIQDAVTKLPNEERQALQVWLNSQTEPVITLREEELLLKSLDDGIHELDAGKGVAIDEVRKRIGSWAAR